MTDIDALSWPKHTQRLELRRGRAEDAAEVWQWRKDPRVQYWLTRAWPDEAEHAEHWGNQLSSSVVGILDGRVVASGNIAIEDAWSQAEVKHGAKNEQAELGWSLDAAEQGKGLGAEFARAMLKIAFEDIGLHRVYASCFADNEPSWRVMQRVGMRREGLFRAESLRRDGRWLDSMIWAMLDVEYKKSMTGGSFNR